MYRCAWQLWLIANMKQSRVYWASKAGHRKFVALVESQQKHELCDASVEHWLQNVKPKVRNNKIQMRCIECGVTGMVMVQGYAKSFRFTGCFCSGKLRWNTKEGLQRFEDRLKQSRFELVLCPLAEGHPLTAFSRIKLACRECDEEVDCLVRTLFSQEGGTVCGCTNPTERIVVKAARQMVQEYDGFAAVETQAWYPDLYGSGAKRLYHLMADCAIVQNDKVVLFIEVDGGFHFGLVKYGGQACTTMEHDLKKEKYCIKHGIPMFRISTNMVNKDEKFWKPLLKQSIEASLAGCMKGIVRVSNTSCYLSLYASKRIGTALEVHDSIVST